MAAGAAAHSKHGDRTDGLCTPPHRSAANLLWWTALGSAAVAETADAAAILPATEVAGGLGNGGGAEDGAAARCAVSERLRGSSDSILQTACMHC